MKVRLPSLYPVICVLIVFGTGNIKYPYISKPARATDAVSGAAVYKAVSTHSSL